MTSADGVSWTYFASLPRYTQWWDMTWSPELGMFAAVSASGSDYTHQIMTSRNGWDWTLVTHAQTVSGLYSVAWSPKFGFLAVGTGTMRSTDGVTWTNVGTLGGDGSERTVIWCAERALWVLATNSGIVFSSDGVTWTYGQTSLAIASWKSIAWAPQLNKFVAIYPNRSPSAATSTDLITWTPASASSSETWQKVKWSSRGYFVSIGASQYRTSKDGITWTPITGGGDGMFDGVWAEERGLFVMVGNANGGVNKVSLSTLLDYDSNTQFVVPDVRVPGANVFIRATDQ